jgi:glycosyltransferase involved in cell wall biosynthesis
VSARSRTRDPAALRVAMVLLDYLPVQGGAQRQLAALAPLLRDRGVEMHVVTRRAPGAPARECKDGVAVRRLPAPGPRALAGPVFAAAALTRVAALRPDVVHAFSLFSPSLVAIWAKRLLGVGTLCKVLRGGRAGDVERLRGKPLAGMRVRRLRAAIDGLVAISDEIDAELDALGIPAARRHRIPNGVDTRRFQPAPPEEQARRRRELGLPAAPIVVYCGRLVPEKRVDVLLEAWRGVEARLPGANLVIVGDGVEAAALRRSAGPGVRFVGEADDVLPFLQAADVFALPSDTEGSSNALLEAMAAGLPVVATRVGAATEVVAEGAGRLVAPGDAVSLASALEAILTDPARARLGAAGRARVVSDYALAGVADRLVRLYREVAPRAAVREPGGGRLAAGRRAS